MPQNIDFPVRVNGLRPAHYIEIEPGDATRYRFVVALSTARHNWGNEDGPVVIVASVYPGPLLPGITMPIKRIIKWWDDTKGQIAGESLEHQELQWAKSEAEHKLAKERVNPWTVRGAFLAVLKIFDKI